MMKRFSKKMCYLLLVGCYYGILDATLITNKENAMNIKRMIQTDMFLKIMCAAPWVIAFMVWG